MSTWNDVFICTWNSSFHHKIRRIGGCYLKWRLRGTIFPMPCGLTRHSSTSDLKSAKYNCLDVQGWSKAKYYSWIKDLKKWLEKDHFDPVLARLYSIERKQYLYWYTLQIIWWDGARMLQRKESIAGGALLQWSSADTPGIQVTRVTARVTSVSGPH